MESLIEIRSQWYIRFSGTTSFWKYSFKKMFKLSIRTKDPIHYFWELFQPFFRSSSSRPFIHMANTFYFINKSENKSYNFLWCSLDTWTRNVFMFQNLLNKVIATSVTDTETKIFSIRWVQVIRDPIQHEELSCHWTHYKEF